MSEVKAKALCLSITQALFPSHYFFEVWHVWAIVLSALIIGDD